MKKLDELAHLLANPVLPKASRCWSGANVLIASTLEADHLRSSFYSREREVLTEHALEVSYFFEVLGDHFYEGAFIHHCSKIEFFRRLAGAANACLLEQADATAHLLCAAVLREACAVAKRTDEGEFDSSHDQPLSGQWTGYSSVKETIAFFRGDGIQIHGTV